MLPEFKNDIIDNLVINGDASCVLDELTPDSVDLIFTSPPYYNARKEYSNFASYEDYLSCMRDVIIKGRNILRDGKFFIINSSHIIIPRESRWKPSKRIPVPFDLHRIMMEEDFEFIDDIIWEKPEGAGWSSGRGRRFTVDRNPMQYKTVPITEYVMVYRKKPCSLIDKHIRAQSDDILAASKISDDYEATNVWKIPQSRDKRHPAVFPLKLAENIIKYYSFVGDTVLDPFGGIGTTAKAAAQLGRKFIIIEKKEEYVNFCIEDLEDIKTKVNFLFTFVSKT